MITIRGYGDDTVTLSGDINDEFHALPDPEDITAGIIGFSDGTLIRVTRPGRIWRITLIARGVGTLTIDQANERGPKHSDCATLDSAVWALFGREYTSRLRERA